jgi:hypothetical protein
MNDKDKQRKNRMYGTNTGHFISDINKTCKTATGFIAKRIVFILACLVVFLLLYSLTAVKTKGFTEPLLSTPTPPPTPVPTPSPTPSPTPIPKPPLLKVLFCPTLGELEQRFMANKWCPKPEVEQMTKADANIFSICSRHHKPPTPKPKPTPTPVSAKYSKGIKYIKKIYPMLHRAYENQKFDSVMQYFADSALTKWNENEQVLKDIKDKINGSFFINGKIIYKFDKAKLLEMDEKNEDIVCEIQYKSHMSVYKNKKQEMRVEITSIDTHLWKLVDNKWVISSMESDTKFSRIRGTKEFIKNNNETLKPFSERGVTITADL